MELIEEARQLAHKFDRPHPDKMPYIEMIERLSNAIEFLQEKLETAEECEAVMVRAVEKLNSKIEKLQADKAERGKWVEKLECAFIFIIYNAYAPEELTDDNIDYLNCINGKIQDNRESKRLVATTYRE